MDVVVIFLRFVATMPVMSVTMLMATMRLIVIDFIHVNVLLDRDC